MVNYICLNYYLLSEKFTKHGNNMILNDLRDKVSMTNLEHPDETIYNTAYGDDVN